MFELTVMSDVISDIKGGLVNNAARIIKADSVEWETHYICISNTLFAESRYAGDKDSFSFTASLKMGRGAAVIKTEVIMLMLTTGIYSSD